MGTWLLFVLFPKETAEQPVVLDGFEVFAEFLAADAEIFQGALEVVCGLFVVEEGAYGGVFVVQAGTGSAQGVAELVDLSRCLVQFVDSAFEVVENGGIAGELAGEAAGFFEAFREVLKIGDHGLAAGGCVSEVVDGCPQVIGDGGVIDELTEGPLALGEPAADGLEVAGDLQEVAVAGLEGGHEFLGAGEVFALEAVIIGHDRGAFAAAIYDDYLIANESVGGDAGFGVFADMGLCLIFDVQHYEDLGIAIEVDGLHGTHLHPREPDIVTRLKALNIIKDDMQPDRLYKGLVLAADRKYGDDQDSQPDGDKDPYCDSFPCVVLIHAFVIKL